MSRVTYDEWRHVNVKVLGPQPKFPLPNVQPNV